MIIVLHKVIDSIASINAIPVGVVFLVTAILLGNKYFKYQKVVNQLEEYEKTKMRIDSGEKMVVFIIDSFKCTSCMQIFAKVKNIVEKAGLPFVAIDSRSQQSYVSHSDVPALLVFHDGHNVKNFDPMQEIQKTDLEQYESFIKEVKKEWKNL